MDYEGMVKQLRAEISSSLRNRKEPKIEDLIESYNLTERERVIVRQYASRTYEVYESRYEATREEKQEYLGTAETKGAMLALCIGGGLCALVGLFYGGPVKAYSAIGSCAGLSAEVFFQPVGRYFMKERLKAISKPYDKEIFSLEKEVLKQLSAEKGHSL